MTRYGQFDDANREYVISRPDTPWPWINYLGSERFFGLISNTAGGYSFYRDASFRRLTRYRYNNVPIDDGGRYYYIKQGDTIWNPGWKPCKTALDRYECRHGMGYTRFLAEKDDIAAELCCLVPLGVDAEVHRLRLRNTSSSTISLQAFSLTEWCLWNALDDQSNFQRNFSTGEVQVDGRAIYHLTEYRERRNHFAFAACTNRDPDGFDTDRERFIGMHNSFAEAQAVHAGACTGSIASGWSPIAAQQHDITLAAGEQVDLVFVIGYAENADEEKWLADGSVNLAPAQAVIERFATSAAVDAALDELSRYWDHLLGLYQVRSGNAKLDRMVNIWNAYQCMVTFNFSRSASFFESGMGRGMGFRDSSQDLLGFVHMAPDRARERLLDIAATQLRDGGALHQYQPLTKRGNAAIGDNFNDDPLWLILGVDAYIRETGDTAILNEIVDFENDASLAAPLLEHLWRSFRFTLNNLGPHGLPLIGRADWNDCLNLNCFSTNPDESYQTAGQKGGDTAESLMIAGLFCSAGQAFAALLEQLGQRSDEVGAGVARIQQAITEHGRDEAWFLRAYDAESKPIGSAQNAAGKIFIESQGWCIMGGNGLDDGFAKQALDAVEEHLATDFGIVLQQPAFPLYDKRLGEISSYPPGYKENAGIFCHNNPWISIAECMAGDPERAWSYYTRICPAFLEDQEGMQEQHRTEPYVYSQMVAGKDAVRHGEAKNSWLTGTAAWNYLTITQAILGVRPEHAGLRIDPKLPAELEELTITRVARGCTYTITVQRGDEPGITVDGQAISGTVIPWSDRKQVAVSCVLAPVAVAC